MEGRGGEEKRDCSMQGSEMKGLGRRGDSKLCAISSHSL